MNNVGIRFKDGSEVIYLTSSRVERGNGDYLQILDADNNEVAKVLIADVHELLDVPQEAVA